MDNNLSIHDEEVKSLRKQIEILASQKEILARQLEKIKNETTAIRAESGKKIAKLSDEIRVRDMELKALRNYLDTREAAIKEQLREDFRTIEMEKERLAEVSNELEMRRKILENQLAERSAEFEGKIKKREEIFAGEKKELLEKINLINSASAEKDNKIANLRGALESAKKSFASQMEAATSELEKMKKQVEEYSRELQQNQNFSGKGGISRKRKNFSVTEVGASSEEPRRNRRKTEKRTL